MGTLPQGMPGRYITHLTVMEQYASIVCKLRIISWYIMNHLISSFSFPLTSHPPPFYSPTFLSSPPPPLLPYPPYNFSTSSSLIYPPSFSLFILPSPLPYFSSLLLLLNRQTDCLSPLARAYNRYRVQSSARLGNVGYCCWIYLRSLV